MTAGQPLAIISKLFWETASGDTLKTVKNAMLVIVSAIINATNDIIVTIIALPTLVFPNWLIDKINIIIETIVCSPNVTGSCLMRKVTIDIIQPSKTILFQINSVLAKTKHIVVKAIDHN